jgi:hypothetical protein
MSSARVRSFVQGDLLHWMYLNIISEVAQSICTDWSGASVALRVFAGKLLGAYRGLRLEHKAPEVGQIRSKVSRHLGIIYTPGTCSIWCSVVICPAAPHERQRLLPFYPPQAQAQAQRISMRACMVCMFH